jgi:sugar phosphate isomerase/epimerase
MKYAICNETFENWEHPHVCQLVSDLGYTGLELAPFTLAPRITDVSADRRKALRRQAEDCGLKLIGLHWLLAKTQGLHLTSPDEATRARTAEYLIELTRCTRDLGGDLMVFGSPAQRNLPEGMSRDQGFEYAADTFRRIGSALADCGVRVCLEPLTPAETNFMTSADEGFELMERIGHPNFCLHLDVKAMSSEGTPVPDIIRKHAKHTGHFHANDPNKRGPGFGHMDFVPIFTALKQSGYKGWVSVEVFDYTPDPETIARESLRYMKQCDKAAG